MTRGPKETRTPDAISGVKVMRMANGEEVEDFGAAAGKDKAAQTLGRRGGQARATKLSAEQRSKIARKAARARWR
jgi:hypothetical protein